MNDVQSDVQSVGFSFPTDHRPATLIHCISAMSYVIHVPDLCSALCINVFIISIYFNFLCSCYETKFGPSASLIIE